MLHRLRVSSESLCSAMSTLAVFRLFMHVHAVPVVPAAPVARRCESWCVTFMWRLNLCPCLVSCYVSFSFRLALDQNPDSGEELMTVTPPGFRHLVGARIS